LGVVGVLVVFFTLGALLSSANRRFLAAPSISLAYGAMVAGAWLGFAAATSPLVLAQIFVFFCLPQLSIICWRLVDGGRNHRFRR
jgi:hypothetical protein